ncbi:MAG: hypothetical protein ACO2ZI_07475, partial [Paracoccaceae bacterium]
MEKGESGNLTESRALLLRKADKIALFCGVLCFGMAQNRMALPLFRKGREDEQTFENSLFGLAGAARGNVRWMSTV